MSDEIEENNEELNNEEQPSNQEESNNESEENNENEGDESSEEGGDEPITSNINIRTLDEIKNIIRQGTNELESNDCWINFSLNNFYLNSELNQETLDELNRNNYYYFGIENEPSALKVMHFGKGVWRFDTSTYTTGNNTIWQDIVYFSGTNSVWIKATIKVCKNEEEILNTNFSNPTELDADFYYNYENGYLYGFKFNNSDGWSFEKLELPFGVNKPEFLEFPPTSIDDLTDEDIVSVEETQSLKGFWIKFAKNDIYLDEHNVVENSCSKRFCFTKPFKEEDKSYIGSISWFKTFDATEEVYNDKQSFGSPERANFECVLDSEKNIWIKLSYDEVTFVDTVADLDAPQYLNPSPSMFFFCRENNHIYFRPASV